MPPRSPWMKRRILGFQRRVWWPKWTPASSSSRMPISGMRLPLGLTVVDGARTPARGPGRRVRAGPRCLRRARGRGRRNSHSSLGWVLHDLVRGFVDTEAYARGRPRLGPEPVAVICEAVGGPRVLELGAGTGLVSRALVDAGLDVVALEPLAAMRAQLERAIGAERVLAGRAEAIPLADGSVDGAVASDAFHWFDGPRAAAELHRVVRPGGGVVVCVTDAAGADGRPAWELDLGAVLDELARRG